MRGVARRPASRPGRAAPASGVPVDPEVSTASGAGSSAASHSRSSARISAAVPCTGLRLAGLLTSGSRVCLPESPTVTTPAQWLEGARPRTLPAAVSPVLAGTGVAAYVDQAVWWKAAARAGGRARAAGRRELRQRLLRRHPRHRRRPGRPAAAGRLRRRHARGAVKRGGVRGVRRRRWSPGWCSPRPRVVAGAGRRAARSWPRGSTPAARSPTATTALGEVMVFVFFGLVAVVGHDVRADRDAPAARAGTPRSGSARWPARSWSPTTCATSRPTATSASARWRWCSATQRTRALYALLVGAAAGRAGRASRCRTSRLALLGLVFLLPAVPAARLVLTGAAGRDLVPVLQRTGVASCSTPPASSWACWSPRSDRRAAWPAFRRPAEACVPCAVHAASAGSFRAFAPTRRVVSGGRRRG